MPSNFDCDLAFTLGATAAALVAAGRTAYMATAHCLESPPSEWRVCGTPLYSLLSAESRAGQAVAAIRPSQVDLASGEQRRWQRPFVGTWAAPAVTRRVGGDRVRRLVGPHPSLSPPLVFAATFKKFTARAGHMLATDAYCNPGPLQFEGPLAHNLCLGDEPGVRGEQLREVAAICRQVEASCWPGCPEAVLRIALSGLRAVQQSLEVLQERDAGEQTLPLNSHARATQLSSSEIEKRDN